MLIGTTMRDAVHSVLLLFMGRWARTHKVPICIKLQNQGSQLELQDIWLGLPPDQN